MLLPNTLLPRKLTHESRINLVYTSSMLFPNEAKDFARNIKRLQKDFPLTSLLEPKRAGTAPSYLAGSENERLRILRRAFKDGDWILPVSGGTGCVDVLRYLNDDDLAMMKHRRPIVNGFSDTTALANFLYFKAKLCTFVHDNADSLYHSTYADLFFSVLEGKRKAVTFEDPKAHWLTEAKPQQPIEGIAIGGNFSTFRDLLEVCEIRPRSWEPFILFIEEIDQDIEDLHRIIIALDARGIFKHIVALVVGRMNDRSHVRSLQELIFATNKSKPKEVSEIKNVFEYLILDVIEDRMEEHDPLYILKINEFGHINEKSAKKIFIPIGAKTRIHPDGSIEFIGPFVD